MALRETFFAQGLRVWVRDPYNDGAGEFWRGAHPHATRPLFVPAVVQSRDGETVTVQTLWQPAMAVAAPYSELYPMNERADVDDLMQLAHLHEASLLHAVQARYERDQIYTLAGSILVCVNPYRMVTDADGHSIYAPEVMGRYRNRVPKHVLDAMPAARREAMAVQPHIFATADDAFVALLGDKADQSIVISGESGAGKSETAKLVIQYLTSVNASRRGTAGVAANQPAGARRRGSMGTVNNPFAASGLSEIEQRLLQSSPVLEAFGNAKTVRNDNSSRFGKFIRIFFAASGEIAGADVSTYLLEKSRVVSMQPDPAERQPKPLQERNYHIFYQLLRGASAAEREQLHLRQPSAYRYLGTTRGCFDVDHVDDAAELANVRRSMAALGVSREEDGQILRVLAAVLELGQLAFSGGEESSLAAASHGVAGTVEELLGLAPGTAARVLTTRTMTARGTTTTVPLKVGEAADSRDALAKALYGRLFDWVLRRVNGAILNDSPLMEAARRSAPAGRAEPLFIGLLDIFGFEVFEHNSFEQLCINYANERLQQFFTQHVFKLEVETYVREQIDYSDVSFDDNQTIIDLIDKKPMGVLSLLDEACLFPRSTDSSFLQKLNSSHKRNAHFGRAARQQAQSCFVVKHCAADVTYNVAGFLEKNKDRLAETVCEALHGSELSLLQEMFAPDDEGDAGAEDGGGGGSRSTRSTLVGANAFLGSKFKESIGQLMRQLGRTVPHFVRCLKPNTTKRPSFFEPDVTHHQLQYLGVLDSIRIRHIGFSFRTPYRNFYDRFVIMVPASGEHPQLTMIVPPNSDMRALCEQLLGVLWSMARFDLTMDRARHVQFGTTMIFLRKQTIQSLEALREVKLQDMDKAAVLLQSVYRMHSFASKWRAMRGGFMRAQASWRATSLRKKFTARKNAIFTVQRLAHTFLTRRWFLQTREASLLLQGFMRKFIERLRWRRLRRGLKVIHSLSRGFIVRQHVLAMLRACRLLQKASRSFLVRNRVHWDKVHLALRLQGLYRGRLLRGQREDLVKHLEVKRGERFRYYAVRKVQAHWKGLLIKRRFRQLYEGAKTLQRWSKSRSERQRYLEMKYAARLLQSGARGMLARCAVRAMKTTNMVSDEQWRLKTVREREALQLAKLNARDPNTGMSVYSLTKKSSQVHKMLDVDVVVDTSDIYPNGLCLLIGELELLLGKRGQRTRCIASGAAHTVLLTDGGDVYTWGWGDHGQLGHGGMANEPKPRLVELLLYHNSRLPDRAGPNNQLRVRQIAVGEDHTVALSDQGRVYTWGSGRRGQLGHGDTRTSPTPRVVESLRRRVAEIACGAHHTMALVEAGAVYSWGSGAQIGQGVFAGSGRGDSAQPTPVKALGRMRVRHIAAGWGHSLALSHSGDVYAWGSGRNGQLGFGDNNDRLTPAPIESLRGQNKHARMATVACGSRHSVALSSSGKVLVWGWNRNGQLGLGDTEDRLSPCLNQALREHRVTHVACGWRHTTALTDDLVMFAWGHAACVRPPGPIEVSEDPDVDTTQFETLLPQPVPLPGGPGRTPTDLHCSWSHTVSITGVTFSQRANDMLAAAMAQDTSYVLGTAEAILAEANLELLRDDDVAGIPGAAAGAAAAAAAAVSLPPPPYTPQQLRSMSAAQLRALVLQLQTAEKRGFVSSTSSVAGESDAAAAVVQLALGEPGSPRSPRRARRISRTRTTDVKLQGREAGWNNSIRVERQRPRSFSIEASARTDLLKFQTSQRQEEAAAAAASGSSSFSVPAIAEEPEEGESEEDRRLRERREALRRERAAQQAAARELRAREGGVSSEGLSQLFSPEHVIRASNPHADLSGLDRTQLDAARQQQQDDNDVLDVFRKQQERAEQQQEEEEAAAARRALEAQQAAERPPEFEPVRVGQGYRRPAEAQRRREEIEREILGDKSDAMLAAERTVDTHAPPRAGTLAGVSGGRRNPNATASRPHQRPGAGEPDAASSTFSKLEQEVEQLRIQLESSRVSGGDVGVGVGGASPPPEGSAAAAEDDDLTNMIERIKQEGARDVEQLFNA